MTALPPPTVETLAVALKGLRDLLDERFAAQQAALGKSDIHIAAAQASANEWRAAMNDFATRLMPRSEYDIHHQDIVGQVDRLRSNLTEDMSRLSGRISTLEGKSSGTGYAVSVSLSGFALIAVLIDVGLRLLK